MLSKAGWELEPTSSIAHPWVLNKKVILLFIYIINKGLDLSLIKTQNQVAYLEMWRELGVWYHMHIGNYITYSKVIE